MNFSSRRPRALASLWSLALFLIGLASVSPVTAQTVITNGTTYTGQTFTGTVTQAAGVSAAFADTTLFTGATYTLGSAGSAAYVIVGPSGRLTFDGTTTASGSFAIAGYEDDIFTNSGSLTATAGTNSVYGPIVTNLGAMTVDAGASLYFGYYDGEMITNGSTGMITAGGVDAQLYLHNVINQGTVTAQNSGSVYFTGSSTTANLGKVVIASGGHAYLNNTLDNTAATLTAPTGGSYELNSGTITNGTIGADALSFTSSGGTLDHVAYTGDLTLPASATVTFTNGTTYSGSNLTVGPNAALYWNQNGSLVANTVTMGSGTSYGYIGVGANHSLTFDSATTVNGVFDIYGDIGATITNEGVINANSSGTSVIYAPLLFNSGTINLSSGALYLGNDSSQVTSNTSTGAVNVTGGTAQLYSPFLNGGLLNVQAGTLYTNSYLTDATGGTIKGSGNIIGDLTLAGGALAPGNSIGTLTLTSGNFAVTAASTFAVELGGSNADKLTFATPGTVNLGAGLLQLSLTLLSAPTPNTTFTLMEISSGGSGITGYFAGLPNSGDIITANYLGTPYSFNVTYLTNGIFLSVPEPSTYALFGLGLGLLAACRRRRR